MEGNMMIQAKEIAGGQWQRFRDALKSADLPADDIDLPGRTFFEFTLDSETVAWGGFETHGTDGLLRSLVVVSTYRSKGVARFHLLTTTASGFFEQQGYALNQRGSAPSLISQTEQFRGLCPGSACYMCKALSANARK